MPGNLVAESILLIGVLARTKFVGGMKAGIDSVMLKKTVSFH